MLQGLALIVVVVVLVGLLAWVVRLRARLVQTERQRAAAAVAHGQLLMDAERARWVEWWLRCAAETTVLDPARPLVFRWAIAAACAPNLDRLHCDLQRIVDDPSRSLRERSHAKAFVGELSLRKRGSTAWENLRTAGGDPDHNEHVLARVYHAALHEGWGPLLAPPDAVIDPAVGDDAIASLH